MFKSDSVVSGDLQVRGSSGYSEITNPLFDNLDAEGVDPSEQEKQYQHESKPNGTGRGLNSDHRAGSLVGSRAESQADFDGVTIGRRSVVTEEVDPDVNGDFVRALSARLRPRNGT